MREKRIGVTKRECEHQSIRKQMTLLWSTVDQEGEKTHDKCVFVCKREDISLKGADREGVR